MVKTPVRAVIDTNILISSFIFGGNPRKIIQALHENKFVAITTPTLISELLEVLAKKFYFTPDKLFLVEELIKETFLIVHPTNTIDIVRDIDDNRVLEAADQGKCQYIVTGDKDLLDLKKYQKIKIIPAEIFLKVLS